MGASAVPIVLVTLFWAAIGGVLPFFVRKGPNRGVTQSCLILTAVVCWLFWLYCYMAQMNPLIGPDLKKNILLLMDRQWGHFKPE